MAKDVVVPMGVVTISKEEFFEILESNGLDPSESFTQAELLEILRLTGRRDIPLPPQGRLKYPRWMGQTKAETWRDRPPML